MRRIIIIIINMIWNEHGNKQLRMLLQRFFIPDRETVYYDVLSEHLLFIKKLKNRIHH